MAGNLIRFDSENYGTAYVRPEDIRILGDRQDGHTTIGVLMASGHTLDFTVKGEIDEVAADLERCAPGLFDIIRLN